jgi:purine nucleoside permease
MEKQSIIQKLGTRKKGAFATIVTKKELGKGEILAKLASEAGKIEKISIFQVKLHAYVSRKDIREAIEAGEREAPSLPPHVESCETLANGLNFWHGKNSQIYLALPTANTKSKAIYFRNGAKVSKEEIAHFLCAKKSSESKFVAPKLENIFDVR